MVGSEQSDSVAFEDLTFADVAPVSSPETSAPEAVPPSPEVSEVSTPATDTPAAPDAPAPSAVPAPPEATHTTPEPFHLTVDGRSVPLEGITRLADGTIQFPAALWDQEIAPKYLANREAWTAKERGYTRALQERDQQVQASRAEVATASEQSHVARRFLETLVSEAQADPTAFVTRLDTIIAEMPLRIKRAELDLREQSYASRDHAEHTAREAEAASAADQQLEHYLGSQVEQALAGPYKALASTPSEQVDLLRELQGLYGTTLFTAVPAAQATTLAGQGWQVLGQVNGHAVGFHPDRFRQILDQRLGKLRAIEARFKAVSTIEQRNAATLAPTAPRPPAVAPPPAPVRNAEGQFARATSFRQARKALADLTLDDLAD